MRDGKVGAHIEEAHGRQALGDAVVAEMCKGRTPETIGRKYDISSHRLDALVTETLGVNVSSVARKRVRSWAPKEFSLETTTVWSFKSRGNWATHSGRYRGNWSPYIPRNVILRYSEPGDLVLDAFVGSGTTAVEAKLLGRRCVGIDINPAAVELARQNLRFDPPRSLFGEVYEPEVRVGDARDLGWLGDESTDLVCTHPPYAGIIGYSGELAGDLSRMTDDDYLDAMEATARELYRVLKPGGCCAVLLGDARRNKRVVPLGLWTIERFLRVGFKVRELVIKR
ncbi:MAG: TRM11 family SAM-dependent methyltransferase, partial [Armatimonadota bacterium]